MLLELAQPRLGGGDLELALAHVLEVLGRAHDQVDDRARRTGTATPRWRSRPASGRRSGAGRPRRSRRPARARSTTRNSSSRLTARFSPSFSMPKTARAPMERGECSRAAAPAAPVREAGGPSSVADAEEHQDHGGHHDGHQADHRAGSSGPSLVHRRRIAHSVEARARAGLAHQVGDQVDRAGGEHRAVRARRARARAPRAARGSATVSAGGPPSFSASDAERGRRQRARVARAREHHAVERRQQLREHAGGVLVLEHADHRHARPAVAEHLGERLGQRRAPRPGCGRRRRP